MSDKHSIVDINRGERLTVGDLGDFEEFDGFDGLSPKRMRFVCEFLKDGNATQAAVRAGYSPQTAQSQSSDLLSKPMVRKAIADRMRAAAVAAGVDAALVVSHLFDVATANPLEIMRLVVRPCELCWPAGLQLDDPNPLCEPCGGRGRQAVHLTDTSKLSHKGRALIKRIKETKNGIEVELRDQDKALELLGKVCGIYTERQELSGPGGTPIEVKAATATALTTLTNQELENILRKQGRPLPQRTIEGVTGQ